jgi:hypothetical protein
VSYGSIISEGAGTAIGPTGAIIGGKQQSDLLNYQADIQTRNAYEARSSAEFNAHRQMITADKVMGNASANYGSAGVDASSGSVLSVLGASAANAELDRQNILHGGEIRAVNYENQANIDRLGANNALNASYFNAIASAFGGAGRLAEGLDAGGGSSSGTTPGPTGAGAYGGDTMMPASNNDTEVYT